MSDFPLIKSLENPNPENKTPLPRGLKYTEMKVIVENEEHTIHVPEREATEFRNAIEGKKLSDYDFKQLLRKHRGVRG